MQTTEDHRSPARPGPRLSAVSLLVVAPGLAAFVLVVVVALISVPVAAVLAVLLAVACLLWANLVRRTVTTADDHVLDALGAADVDADSHARLHNVVEGLCLTMGVTKPRLLSFDEDAPAIGAAATTGGNSAIFVSTGFSETMDRMEHEAVVAHLLVRVRSGDISSRTVSLALGDAVSKFGLEGIVGALLARASSAQPLHEADAAACGVTRYPPALVTALSKIAAGPALPVDVATRVGELLVAVPGTGDAAETTGVPSVETARLTLDERIELLKEI